MRLKSFIIIVIAVVALAFPSCRRIVPYNNPVIQGNTPDPTVLDNRERDGWFYLASTTSFDVPDHSAGERIVLPVYRSRDLVNWEYVCDGFRGIKPSWCEEGELWAPDMNYINGKYVLYYALGVWNDIKKSGCGVAVADSPAGPYTDMGMLVDYATTGVTNSIDPFYFDDGAGKYFFWGSVNKDSGIWVYELSPDGLSLKPGSEKIQIGNKKVEAIYIHKRKGFYYAFASYGFCCNGVYSTYHVVVARSSSLLGPYEGKNGESFLDPEYNEDLLHNSPDSTFTGTGHNAEIITDDVGQDWIIFHSYWKGSDYSTRSASMEPLYWDADGWPYIPDGHPHASHALSPVFKHK